ncbi:amidase domain-containing protein [Paenibacillus melissococcoides]|uniref:Amidase domain-containing protein n=1 Tax=Paenibacillus melissococcoides TaxID=2912268 RepID=A0ABN8U310_9BACL|nr:MULTISPECIES: amidase domain-containing protein [Paenibacillus]MEB9893377.1 amidase domain-containing protein [Bacillus cereus]CAH8244077.1 amidase domain-containing protein [Paenibacillus melissococcoides]CAH8703908.1 amidase domain-containing protein [Paenibacillus melissococcoides]CAH8706521.1 amidase domain-containing protein [Paenibacillus melissococcoides]GIO79704.1 exported protein [Paenibacillus dendritiformis]
MVRKTMFIMLSLCCIWITAIAEAASSGDKDEEVTGYIQQVFKDRTNFLIHQQEQAIRDHYAASGSSRHALRHEIDRSAYIHAWAERRGMQFINADSDVRIIRAKVRGNKATVSVVESLRLDYIYTHSVVPTQSFGIGTRHAITLTKEDGKWKVLREWYLDPLEENPKLIPEADDMMLRPQLKQPSNDADRPSTQSDTKRRPRYNRQKAVAYANKYAGTAWGAGNKHRYNPKYRDYTGLGGDCTNFASQCIGDPEEGGGLKMRGGWHYFLFNGGSQTWVQTDAFKNFLLHSGYGKMIAKGKFTDIVKPSERHPAGAIAKLQPGDLIGYDFNGDVDHFSVVVGFDDFGYPLVNSHTADRYRVPFDLGWDRNTTYLLIHIRD